MNSSPRAVPAAVTPLESRGITYPLQRAYVRLMMWLISRLLQAAAAVDGQIRREVADLPDDFRFVMRVRSGAPALAMRKVGERLMAVPPNTVRDPDLVFEFKHPAHAFLVLSFQESTPRAFANDRLAVNGEFAGAMKVLRALNRMQALVLPRFIARRALKAYPPIPLRDKLGLAIRIYARLVVDLFRREAS